MKQVVTIEEIDWQKLVELGNGIEGIVYRMEDKAIKIFSSSFLEQYGPVDSYVDPQLDHKFSNYIFPIAKIQSNYLTIGIIMDYIHGCKLKNTRRISLNHIIRALRSLEENTEEVSKRKIIISDVHPDNVIYSKTSTLYILDTLTYHYEEDKSDEACRCHNIKQLNNCVISALFGPNPEPILEPYLQSRSLKESFDGLYQNDPIYISSFLENLQDVAQIDRIHDLKKKVKIR